MSENKLQLRAKVLNSLSVLMANSSDKELVAKSLKDLALVEDKKFVFDVLLKEFVKENSQVRDLTIAYVLKNIFEQPFLETTLFEVLTSPKIPDLQKAKIVDFLREIGKHIDYNEYVSYFENPDEVIDLDTKKLLENAKVNPEAQIDFLDFIYSLPEAEKSVLVESLANDYDGDNLANILIPLIQTNPYSELSQLCIKSLGETKSYLAYAALLQIDEFVDSPQVKANIQKSLSLLRLSGVREDISKEYYRKILSVSPVYKCYVSFPDGHGNVGIIFSRKSESGVIQMFALVVNDSDGIVDCFGFNEISDAELDRILEKFFVNNNVVEVSPQFCKYLIVNSEKLARLKYEEISYEYSAWKSITNDIDYEFFVLRNGIEQVELSEFLLKQVFDKGYFDKWFFEEKDNNDFDSIISDLNKNKDLVSIEYIENLINEKFDILYSKEVLAQFNQRLLLSAYLARQNEEELFASILYSLTFDTDVKRLFLLEILKKSIYEYFLFQKEKYSSLKKAMSIFTRKASESSDIDIKFVEKCIKYIEDNWTA